jgi:folylpolyglutamate synthase/dihydropteroate synthase
VFSALAEKDVSSMISLLRTVCPTIIATSSANPRALPAAVVASLAGGPAAEDPGEALEAARVLAGPAGAVVVCGSLYLLHDLALREAG